MPTVKLIKILLGALALFLAIAMAQQWHVFKPWILREKPAVPTLSAAERQEVEAAVRAFLAMSAHFHATGGDERFGERIPAASWLVDELRGDVDYLRKNGRRQVMTLVRLEVTATARQGDDRASLSTREYWVIRTFRLDGKGEVDPPRSQILSCSYALQRTGQAWRVQGWEIEDPAGPVEGAAPPAAAEAK